MIPWFFFLGFWRLIWLTRTVGREIHRMFHWERVSMWWWGARFSWLWWIDASERLWSCPRAVETRISHAIVNNKVVYNTIWRPLAFWAWHTEWVSSRTKLVRLMNNLKDFLSWASASPLITSRFRVTVPSESHASAIVNNFAPWRSVQHNKFRYLGNIDFLNLVYPRRLLGKISASPGGGSKRNHEPSSALYNG